MLFLLVFEITRKPYMLWGYFYFYQAVDKLSVITRFFLKKLAVGKSG